ncbi:unnamed protein product [Thlaspi arvense]|uniref:Uncharacterized protein n=1 Tax=Thlaspi arvense TaxID=13288 RepID=A0AAU9R706_THLAR|nr:unnamed protein product [Thlaspi arvense]
MAMVVPFREGMSVAELKENVLAEFFGNDSFGKSISLSYWPPNSSELVTAYNTPVAGGKRKSVFEEEGSYAKNGRNAEMYDGYGSSAGSKTFPLEVDDEEILSHVEMTEEKRRRERSEVADGDCTTEKFESDSEGSGQSFDEDINVQPMGCDNDFWEPLLDDSYGGSNAAEFMCPPAEEGDNKVNEPRRIIFFSTNSAFDHSVLTGEGSVDDAACKKEGSCGSGYKGVDNVGGENWAGPMEIVKDGFKAGSSGSVGGRNVVDGFCGNNSTGRRRMGEEKIDNFCVDENWLGDGRCNGMDSCLGTRNSGPGARSNERQDDTRKKAGRQKETRYPSVGEIPVSRVKKEKPNKCGCCRNPGHNRTSCPHPK